MSANLTPQEKEAIAAELDSGRKIEAIKLYRQATGMGLKESMEAIENFDQQRDQFLSGSLDFPVRSHDLTSEQVEDITLALANGNKIEAIKIYRGATGLGLKESKDFIDALIPQLKQQDPARFAKANEAGTVGCGVKVLMLLSCGGLGISGSSMAGLESAVFEYIRTDVRPLSARLTD